MCEIIVLNKKKIGKKELISKFIQSASFNPHGAGIAYFFRNKLYYFKSVNSDSITKFLEESYKDIDLPIVIHTRLATGGTIDSSNCHPFDLENPMKLSGKSEGLLFHNGVVSDYLLEIANLGLEIKKEDTDSDTRFLAKILGKLNENKRNKLLSLIATNTHNKFVLLTPKKLIMYGEFHLDASGYLTSVKRIVVNYGNYGYGNYYGYNSYYYDDYPTYKTYYPNSKKDGGLDD